MSSNPDERVIYPRSEIAPSARIDVSSFVAPGVLIGDETEVGPNATILAPTRIGCRVTIGPGAVIGCDGFGYKWTGERHELLEHSGPVVIEDDVHIGANVTIARAKPGRETRIGRGTRIDCLVHIAHNVSVGRDCLIAAQTGIAGSAVLGDGVVLAGQVGVRDHVRIGDGAVVYARSAVFRSVPAGEHYSGIPARPHRLTRRFWARLWRMFGNR